MSFTGIFSTDTSKTATDLVKKSFASTITRLMPNGEAPLFGMTSMLPTETAVQVEHGFFTKTMLFPSLQLDGAVLAADTLLPVDSTANLLPGMVMRFENSSAYEVIIVNSIVSPTQVQVTRGLGSVAAYAHADNTVAYQIGSAYEEGSSRPNALNIKPVRITNLTQIFRNSWAVTDTMRATMMIAGDTNVAESKADCMAFHAADIERALFFGQKSQGVRNGQPFRTMDGLISIVGNLSYYPSSYSSANITVAGSTTTYTQLETALDPCFNQATDPKVANERVLFVGGTAKKVLNQIGRLSGQYQIVDGQTSYGLQFSTFKISRGTFRMIEHPQLNSNATWSKMAIAVDLSSFRVAYLGNRKTRKEEKMATDSDGVDAEIGSLTTELTCVIKNPPANAVIYNLTAGAAS
jgi:hypothetical protein